jgi:hypothetical protein
MAEYSINNRERDNDLIFKATITNMLKNINLENITNSIINFDINYYDSYRNNFLYYAIITNNLELTIYLLENADLTHLFLQNKNIVHLLCSNIFTQLDILELLYIIKNRNPELLNMQDSNGTIPLGYALGKIYDIEQEEKLEIANINIDIKNILIQELKKKYNKYYEIVLFLIENSTNINAVNNNNMSCFHYLCSCLSEKNINLFNLMLNKNVNIYCPYGYFKNVFQLCLYNYKKIYTEILFNNIIKDEKIHIIARYDYVFIMKNDKLKKIYLEYLEKKAKILNNNIYEFTKKNINIEICKNINKYIFY